MSRLDKIFDPKSIAIIGASEKENSVGNGLIKNLVEGGVFKNKYCKLDLDEVLGVIFKITICRKLNYFF